MRILVTRPQIDAVPLAEMLGGRGHDVMIMALLDIRFINFTVDPAGFCAVAATSANGIRALQRCANFNRIRALPLYAVGPASADAARAAGFSHIEVAGGDVDALGTYIAAHLVAGGKKLLHVSGKAAAGDLQALLAARGYDVERIIGYEAVRANFFSDESLAAFRNSEIDAVMLYSPRTAMIFTELVQGAKLENMMKNVIFFCLSKAVAKKLAGSGAGDIRVAGEPNQNALLELVG